MKSRSDTVASPSVMSTKMGKGTSRKAAARSSKLKDALKQSDAVSTFDMLKSVSKLVKTRRISVGLRVLSMFWRGRLGGGLGEGCD